MTPVRPPILRVLIVEDSDSDAELMVRELRRGGFEPEWSRVDRECDYVAGLQALPDIVLAEYHLREFDGLHALELLRELELDIPFIIVSGVIGEAEGAALTRHGANDYVPKDRIARLGAAAKRAVAEKKLREQSRKALEDLRSSEIRFNSFMNNSPTLKFIKDEEGRVLYMNNTCELAWGMTLEECKGKYDHELWPPHLAETLRARDLDVLSSGSPSRMVENIPRAGGNILNVLSFRFAMKDAHGGRMLGGISVDISEQLRTQKALSEALLAKDALLREVHHRVKNNLQVVSSLLAMQAATFHDVAAGQIFEETQHRVQSMALVHEMLNSDGHPDSIDFAAYTGTLTRDLFYSFEGDSSRLRLRLELQPVTLALDHAIPCGLILNELMTNALKYAFPGGRTGEILVGLKIGAGSTVELSVADNGVGLPPDLDWQQSPSLGLRIIEILRHQLRGTVQFSGTAGTRFVLTFSPPVMRLT